MFDDGCDQDVVFGNYDFSLFLYGRLANGDKSLVSDVSGMLKQKFPAATIVMYPKPAAQTITALPNWYPTVKQQGDFFIFGVGD